MADNLPHRAAAPHLDFLSPFLAWTLALLAALILPLVVKTATSPAPEHGREYGPGVRIVPFVDTRPPGDTSAGHTVQVVRPDDEPCVTLAAPESLARP